MHDQFREQRVVVRRDRVAGVDVGIDPHAGTARRVVHGDRPRARLKVAGWVFGVHAALDGVPAQPVPVHHERQRLARGDANLLLHQVEIGAHLGDRVLHLDAGVHLHEVEGPVLVEQEFDRSRADVADRLRQPHGRISDVVPQCLIHGGAGRLLDQLLMAPLHRAVALAQVHDPTVRVAHDLDLDVARPREVLLDVHLIRAERGQRFLLRERERL